MAPGPSADDLAGQLEAGDVGGRAGRRRVEAGDLQPVGAVEPGGPHRDEHLAGAGHGVGVLAPLERAVDDRDRVHGGGAASAAWSMGT